jgi:hypothetical protein
MRQQFTDAKTRKQAAKDCPWAEKIIKVGGGYQCFESTRDYETWKKQK